MPFSQQQQQYAAAWTAWQQAQQQQQQVLNKKTSFKATNPMIIIFSSNISSLSHKSYFKIYLGEV